MTRVFAVPQLSEVTAAGKPSVYVGRIVEITEEGCPIVRYGDAGTRSQARLALSDGPGEQQDWIGLPVLLVLENGNPDRPIIVGFVRDTLSSARAAANRPEPAQSVEIDGKAVTLEGRESVVIRCGDASITLRADGQVVIKGRRLTSRAAETHKIRGASVLIN
jgi:uncharacterized protein DUF6484